MKGPGDSLHTFPVIAKYEREEILHPCLRYTVITAHDSTVFQKLNERRALRYMLIAYSPRSCEQVMW